MIDFAFLEPLVEFGVAGLMGVLWLWERWYSRRREQELSQAHQHLMCQKQELDALIALVERTAAAIERFDKTQGRVADLLDRLADSRRVA